ncbi:MAG: HlyD family efflux transporter periplasmic adaptor subunit [Hyphomicrobiaceae bacterium]
MNLSANKTWIAAGIAGTVVAALVYALRPQPIGVDVATVTTGPMAVLVEEEGRTRVRQVYAVSAPIIGRIMRPALDVGDKVVKGETVVAVIQPTDPPFLDLRSRHEIEAQINAAAAAVELAAAELRQAEGEVEFAETDLTRNERLARSGTVPERTLQKAQLDAVTRRAAVSRAKAQVELRRRQLDSERARLIGPEIPADHPEPSANCCVGVKAPASGRILKRLHESEKVVTPGTTLLEIGDTADIEIVVELLSTDAVKVQPGAAVAVSGWGGNRILPARVRRIEPGGFTKVSALGIDEQRVRAILDFDAVDTTALGHDYRVYTAITTWRAENALRVPLSALFRQGKDWAVFVAKNGRAVRTNVAIDHRNAEMAEVVRGLAPGDRVILHPSDRITDRSRVAPRAE